MPRLQLSTHRLSFIAPLFPDNLYGHLVATAVPGVEEWRDGAYRRTLRFASGSYGIVALRPGGPGVVLARLLLEDASDQPAALQTSRRLLDLDADPAVVDPVLADDPVLAPLIQAAPGRRVPGAAGGDEMAVRAVLGQQVSTAAARTHAGRLVAAVGQPIDDPEGGLTHLFPTPSAVAAARPETFAFPAARQRSLRALSTSLAAGELPPLEPGSDPAAVREALQALPGVGPWTAETVAMRALADGDAFIPTDLGVRAAARALGLAPTPAALTARAQAWRPWRAYAVQHLWATAPHPVNVMPA
ncbi:MAG: DNA-3-methyladenine glycosylase 2 family protein [Solirubrobacteraceae bacterium]|nr:DNA-3-methyladenine glycosylase 2 family protein [Solirubrobacteraceae bacterium]